MPKILFCGDPHGEFRQIVEAVDHYQPAATILLGDIEAPRPLHIELASILAKTEVWWIPGNHDTDRPESYVNLYDSELAHRNLHGRVVEIAGVKIAGLGGVFRGRIWEPGKGPTAYDSPEDYLAKCGKGNRWQGGLPLKHRSSIFPSEVRALKEQCADILVTHEAPDLHLHGNSALTDLAMSMGVNAALHGHHHEDIEYAGGIWRGVGLRSVFVYFFDKRKPAVHIPIQ